MLAGLVVADRKERCATHDRHLSGPVSAAHQAAACSIEIHPAPARRQMSLPEFMVDTLAEGMATKFMQRARMNFVA